MKKIFYIIALGIALAGCSNNEDELLSCHPRHYRSE